jgi:hypothetical protein
MPAQVRDAAHHAELLASDTIEIDQDVRRDAIWTAATLLAAGMYKS